MKSLKIRLQEIKKIKEINMRINNFKYFSLLSTFFISISILISLASCSPEDRLVNTTAGSTKLLTLSDDLPKQLSILNLPNYDFTSNTNIDALNQLFNGKKINQIYNHLEKFYIIINGENKIYIFDEKLENKQEVEINEVNLIPKKILFINATDAYVVYENSNLVGVLDIYYKKFVKNIKFDNNVLTIEKADNFLFISMDNKSIVRYDIRTNQTTQPLNLRNNCNLINFNNKKEIMVFIEGDTINNLSATVLYVNKDDITKNEEVPLNFFSTNNNQFKFYNALNIDNDYIFVTTNLGLVRYDNLNKTSSFKLDNVAYTFSIVFNLTSEILLLDNNSNVSAINYIDNATGNLSKTQFINKKITKLLIFN